MPLLSSRTPLPRRTAPSSQLRLFPDRELRRRLRRLAPVHLLGMRLRQRPRIKGVQGLQQRPDVGHHAHEAGDAPGGGLGADSRLERLRDDLKETFEGLGERTLWYSRRR